jgi:predicted TPR repeat methyltransferase
MTNAEHNENSKGNNIETWLSTAMECHQRGEFGEAAELYRKVLDADPNQFDALHYLGVLYYQKSQPGQALILLEKAVSLAPGDAGCRSNLGLVFLALGKNEKAIESFRAALQKQPDFTGAYNNLGNAFMRAGNIEEAISSYRSALALNNEQPSVYNNLGVALKRQGLLEEAMAEYLKALKLSPGFVDAGANLADVLFQLKRYEDATRCYQQAIQLDPDNPKLRVSLGDVYKATEQWNEAREAYQRTLELNNELSVAVINLGVVAQQMNAIDDAYAYYLRAIEIDPDSAEARNNLGTILFERGDLTAAADAFHKALQISPKFTEARYNLAKTKQGQGHLVEALADYRVMIELNPTDGRGYYGAVKMLDLLEQYEELAELVKVWQSSGADIQLDEHLQAALTGETPRRASDGYVKDQFDGMAGEFENKLAALEYHAPQLIVDALASILENRKGDLAILDTGCGTGLCGVLLRPFAKQLIGVDLSSGMLKVASEKNIYDELIEAELTEYFRNNQTRHDVVVCADTLVYFGALTDVLKGMRAAVSDDGTLAFTVEKLDEGAEYKLSHTGRYAHALDYITIQLQQAGFRISEIREVNLRSERFRPVIGWLVVAHPDINKQSQCRDGRK